MKRTPHKDRMKVDLSKPLDLSTINVDDGTCFGKGWDPKDNACQGCADNDVCCIVKERAVAAKAKEVEKEEGPFLDRAGMHYVTDEQIKNFVIAHRKGLTTESLIEGLFKIARTKDRPSAIERIKRFKATGLIKITEGIVKYTGK